MILALMLTSVSDTSFPPVLISITGLPCSGKSYIGRRLGPMLGLPVFDRDEFCDKLFEVFGHSHEKAYRDKVGYVAGEDILMIMRKELGVGRSLMVEAVLHPHIYNRLFRNVYDEVPFRYIQIVLEASREALEQRYLARDNSTEKLAGHWNLDDYPYKHLLESGTIEPLDLPSEVVRVNTTDMAAIDYEKLLTKLTTLMEVRT